MSNILTAFNNLLNESNRQKKDNLTDLLEEISTDETSEDTISAEDSNSEAPAEAETGDEQAETDDGTPVDLGYDANEDWVG